MISKNFYAKLVTKVLILALVALAMAFFLIKQQYVISAFLLILFSLQTLFLARYLNHNNRKIAFFF